MLRLRYNSCDLMTSDFWEEDHLVVGRARRTACSYPATPGLNLESENFFSDG